MTDNPRTLHGERRARPVLILYIATVLPIVALVGVLYATAPWLIVSSLAIVAGIFEVTAAFVGLSAHRAQTAYPRFMFHLIALGFLCLVASILWQQYLYFTAPVGRVV